MNTTTAPRRLRLVHAICTLLRHPTERTTFPGGAARGMARPDVPIRGALMNTMPIRPAGRCETCGADRKRPYPEHVQLVAIHEVELNDLEEQAARVPELEDSLANLTAFVERGGRVDDLTSAASEGGPAGPVSPRDSSNRQPDVTGDGA